jgi:hypothetical protein
VCPLVTPALELPCGAVGPPQRIPVAERPLTCAGHHSLASEHMGCLPMRPGGGAVRMRSVGQSSAKCRQMVRFRPMASGPCLLHMHMAALHAASCYTYQPCVPWQTTCMPLLSNVWGGAAEGCTYLEDRAVAAWASLIAQAALPLPLEPLPTAPSCTNIITCRDSACERARSSSVASRAAQPLPTARRCTLRQRWSA